jgi:hypothetical protein
MHLIKKIKAIIIRLLNTPPHESLYFIVLAYVFLFTRTKLHKPPKNTKIHWREALAIIVIKNLSIFVF